MQAGKRGRVWLIWPGCCLSLWQREDAAGSERMESGDGEGENFRMKRKDSEGEKEGEKVCRSRRKLKRDEWELGILMVSH